MQGPLGPGGLPVAGRRREVARKYVLNITFESKLGESPVAGDSPTAKCASEGVPGPAACLHCDFPSF